MPRWALAVALLVPLGCDKKPDAKERAVLDLLAAYQAADAAKLDALVDPAAATTDARALSCASEKLAVLDCELSKMSDGKKTCDGSQKLVDDCVCQAAKKTPRYSDSATHAALQKLGLSGEACRIQGVRTLGATEIETELPEWGKSCDHGASAGQHALAQFRCDPGGSIDLVLHRDGESWRFLTLSQKTRTRLRLTSK